MRLDHSALGVTRDGVRWPGYDPSAHKAGIVHLGIGAFHRAHQAVYTDDVLASAGGDWRIIGVSLRSAGVRDQLAPQDGLYSVLEMSDAGESLRVIGAVERVLVAFDDPKAVIAAIADAETHIVSLTVTEKGYCHDPATGRLDSDHAGVARELAGGAVETAIGYLAKGLRARADAGAGPVTLLSCDNLPHNGAVLGQVLRDYLHASDPALVDWIDANIRTPATMVDRIVPATTSADLDRVESLLGARDEGAVKAEPFSQWVIEDDFAGPRPAWEVVGAQFVADVRPFELAKLRMLNGAHSTLAYLGLLAGYETVDQAVAASAIRPIVDRLMRVEAAATLPTVDGLDPQSYADALLARFANPALRHKLIQIAMDGSQKLPQRLLGTIADARAKGIDPDAAIAGVAGWMLHVDRLKGGIDDPMAAELGGIATAAADDGELIDGLLGVRAVFGDLADAVWLGEALRFAVARIRSGARVAA
ncbi:mannitol dehydrogenase family protein [Sphingomonas aestuarii]